MEENKKKFTFKKLFKALMITIIAGIYLSIFIRMFVSCDSPLADKLITDEKLYEAYELDPEGFSVELYELRDFYRSVDDGRLLQLESLYYIPSAEEIQVTVKYNLQIAAAPTDEKLPFDFYLTDETGKEYRDYHYKTDTRFKFGYIRLCFDGIKLIGDELDETGENKRKNYELYMLYENTDGELLPYYSFSLYTGSKNFKKLSLVPEKTEKK